MLQQNTDQSGAAIVDDLFQRFLHAGAGFLWHVEELVLQSLIPVSYTHLDVYKRQLLVSVRLAAQCTDARVNIVVQDLFAKYPNVAALAAAEPCLLYTSPSGWRTMPVPILPRARAAICARHWVALILQ